jgi:low temperature requirement protein LtrA
MNHADASGSLLRRRPPHDHARVTYVELFFDLVFVFAVTQLSHALLAHLIPASAKFDSCCRPAIPSGLQF